MEISQISLALFAVISLAFGLVFGILYDIISPLPSLCGKVHSKKLNEKLSKGCTHKEKDKTRKAKKIVINVAVFFHDILYMIFFGAAFAILVYVCNDGIIRYVAVIGTICGLLLYKKLFRNAVLMLAELVRFLIFRALLCVATFVLIPFRLLARAGKRAADRIRKAKLEKQIVRYDKRSVEELLALAKCGFVSEQEKIKKQRKGKDGYERCCKEEKNNNFCDIIYPGGIGDSVSCEPDELQPASQRGNTACAQKRRA